MSKRSGKTIALHDLLDEVSVDAARYFFNSRAATSPVDFDLDLAVREDSENPGLLCPICPRPDLHPGGPPGPGGLPVPAADQVQGEVLTAEEETALVRTLAQFPEEIHTAARDYDPSRINRYLTDLAGFPPFLRRLPDQGGRNLPCWRPG